MLSVIGGMEFNIRVGVRFGGVPATVTLNTPIQYRKRACTTSKSDSINAYHTEKLRLCLKTLPTCQIRCENTCFLSKNDEYV